MKYTKEQLKQYWVGLMDGAGEIQVNQYRGEELKYRLIIEREYTEANTKMLKKMAEGVGGSVRKEKDKEGKIEKVRWVMSDRKEIEETIKILEQYPPLTTRLEKQLKFMLTCLEHNSVEKYLETRGKKYERKSDEREEREKERREEEPTYFEVWITGYTEGRTEIKERPGRTEVVFSISQKNDRKLIEAIREKLRIGKSIEYVQRKGEWRIETEVTERAKGIIRHYTRVPLIGEKGVTLEKAKERIQEREKQTSTERKEQKVYGKSICE